MPTSYTSLLGLALPVTGELSGTWGDTVNDYITQYVDAAAAGTQTISGSQTAVTLTVTNGSSLTQVGSGASGSAQYAVINCTGNPASLLTITAPASSRQYLIINATSTSQSVKIVGAGPTTGVTLVATESAIVAWNGSDYVKVASSTADGVTTFSAGTTGFTPNSATSGAVTLAGTLATTNGGTGLTSFTANGVVYASSSSALATGSALGFDGTRLLVQTASSNITSSERLTVAGTGTIAANSTSVPAIYAQNTDTTASTNQPYIYLHDGTASRAGLGVNYTDSALVLNGLAGIYFRYGGNGMGTTEGMRITSAGFTQPVAYADTVSALGNTGTAKTIDLKTANVFTATLTGNCTFTLSNPIATGSSSFTLILTNDGTAGRTVAWSGGSFVFPGGAASLSRTTTANAVDVWVFFTPNGGTTWYGNIAMKNMTA